MSEDQDLRLECLRLAVKRTETLPLGVTTTVTEIAGYYYDFVMDGTTVSASDD